MFVYKFRYSDCSSITEFVVMREKEDWESAQLDLAEAIKIDPEYIRLVQTACVAEDTASIIVVPETTRDEITEIVETRLSIKTRRVVQTEVDWR